MGFRFRMIVWIPTLAYAGFLIVGWQKLGLAGPGCLCSVSRRSSRISSSRHVHNEATSAGEKIRPFTSLLKSALTLKFRLPSISHRSHSSVIG
jgi:hypothetical protein